VVTVFMAGRIYETQRGPALHPWHTWAADEMSATEIDHATFAGYLAREETIFRQMRSQLTNTLQDDEKRRLIVFMPKVRSIRNSFSLTGIAPLCCCRRGRAAPRCCFMA
jgi:hypothetical protein